MDEGVGSQWFVHDVVMSLNSYQLLFFNVSCLGFLIIAWNQFHVFYLDAGLKFTS